MENKDVYDDISSIKKIMERSTRFISLSGFSGVLAGIYALIGALLAYKLIYTENDRASDSELFLIALAVLALSIGTGIWLTIRKATRNGQTVWNPSSRALLKTGLLPLLTGGGFILILLHQGYYGLIAASCLIFYGLALAAASQFTYGDVKWLGICEIGLGLLTMLKPGYSLLFWALGFGVLHILYGTIMYFKYDRENNAD